MPVFERTQCCARGKFCRSSPLIDRDADAMSGTPTTPAVMWSAPSAEAMAIARYVPSMSRSERLTRPEPETKSSS